MTRAIALGAVLIALLAGMAVAEQGDDEVMIGGYMLLRLRCSGGGYSADQRITDVQKRINSLVSLDKQEPINVRIESMGNAAAIIAENRLVVTVQPCDARANGTTVTGLASVWAQRLRDLYPKATPVKPGVGEPDGVK